MGGAPGEWEARVKRAWWDPERHRTLLAARAFCPQPEVFSELNPNPSWGPVTPHEAHAVRTAQASGVLADPKLRGQHESQDWHPGARPKMLQQLPLAGAAQEERSPWKSSLRPPTRGARWGPPTTNGQDAGFSGPHPGPGPGSHSASAPSPERQRGSGGGSMGGIPPILLTLGPAALPASSPWMRQTQQVSTLWELVGSIRVRWGPPAVVTALFPACVPGAGNPPASRAPVPTLSQQCASAAKRAWAGLLFGWGFPLLLCSSPPPPAPPARPWNPGPSRWLPPLFRPGCGSSSRDGGVSGPAPTWGHPSRGLAAFLGPASASAHAARAGCPTPGGEDAPELGQG